MIKKLVRGMLPVLILLAVPGSAAIIMVLFPGCAAEEEPPEIIRPVRYQPVYSTGGSRARTFAGVAQAGLESQLSFKVQGNVKNIGVKVGDTVSVGQLIAELDPSGYRLQVQQDEAALVQAQAQSRNTDANYERVKALYENNNASRTDLDAARAASESGKAAVQAAGKQLELSQLHLSYTRLTAPVKGAIAEVAVEVNENVQVGMPVALLTSGGQLEVRTSIPEILIAQINEGDRVEVTFDALEGREFPARVTEVGVASTGMVAAFPVTVCLDDSDAEIRPGMASSVVFHFESRDERIRFLIPEVAGSEDRDGRFVYIVEAIQDDPGFGIVYRREVTTGELTAEGLEVFEGLEDGDLVVTAGVSRITDGQRVRLK